MIGAGIIGPRGGFGLNVTEQDRERWTQQFTSTLTRLLDAAGSHSPAPSVGVALRMQLLWHVEYASSSIRQAARDVVAALPRTLESEVARALHGGPVDPPVDPNITRRHQERRQATEQVFVSRAAMIAERPVTEAVHMIERLLDELHQALGDDGTRARRFLFTAVTGNRDLGEALCVRVLAAPGSRLVSVLAPIMSALTQVTDQNAVTLAYRLLGTEDVDIARQLAHAFGLQRLTTDLLESESDLLRALVRHADRIVVSAALGAVRVLARQHPDFALDLLTDVPASHKEASVSEFTATFGPDGDLSWDILTRSHKAEFQTALLNAKSLDDYDTQQFLAMLSRHDPHRAIDLLTARIELLETNARQRGYSPLPFSWQVPLEFRTGDDFPDLLRRVREWIAAQPGFWVSTPFRLRTVQCCRRLV